jgi:membrane-associated phospholipid phosphatase
MKHHILQIHILLFVILCCLSVSADVRAAGNIETAGDVLMIALPAAAAGLSLGFRDGQGALELGKSTALAIGVTYGLKYTIDEKRPDGGDHSFPSAHASISFSSAEFIRKRYGWNYGIPAYIAATFVAYSRVESDQHYTRDVIAGAGIGILGAYLFTEPYKGWNIQPDVDHAHYGIRLSRNW